MSFARRTGTRDGLARRFAARDFLAQLVMSSLGRSSVTFTPHAERTAPQPVSRATTQSQRESRRRGSSLGTLVALLSVCSPTTLLRSFEVVMRRPGGGLGFATFTVGQRALGENTSTPLSPPALLTSPPHHPSYVQQELYNASQHEDPRPSRYSPRHDGGLLRNYLGRGVLRHQRWQRLVLTAGSFVDKTSRLIKLSPFSATGSLKSIARRLGRRATPRLAPTTARLLSLSLRSMWGALRLEAG